MKLDSIVDLDYFSEQEVSDALARSDGPRGAALRLMCLLDDDRSPDEFWFESQEVDFD
jgi:hypothetical protein